MNSSIWHSQHASDGESDHLSIRMNLSAVRIHKDMSVKMCMYLLMLRSLNKRPFLKWTGNERLRQLPYRGTITGRRFDKRSHRYTPITTALKNVRACANSEGLLSRVLWSMIRARTTETKSFSRSIWKFFQDPSVHSPLWKWPLIAKTFNKSRCGFSLRKNTF